MVKFISKNNMEDFALFDYETGHLISYCNMPSYGSDIAMAEGTKYEIQNYSTTMKDHGLHTAVVSPDEKFLILVDRNNIYKYDIELK